MSESDRSRPQVLITGGTIVDAHGERRGDVVISGGRIVSVETVGGAADDAMVLDATGCVVSSGFVDLHTHLREPGREEAETIQSGARAAVLGGFSAVVAMPNTEPAQDSLAVIDFVRAQGQRANLCEVAPAGCITVGRRGEALAPLAELAHAGVRIFTDDGNGVQDPLVMRHALEYARDLGVTLAQHCEVESLTAGAVMHEGHCCSRLGLPGWPALAEELMVHRDIELCRLTGAGMHFLHLSTARSVELVRAAKADGLAVTAEVTPHHLSLSDELLTTFDTRYKVNPPLRTAADIAALGAGLADGTIDAVATDHAPHTAQSKDQPLDVAPPGMLGLETALAVILTYCDLPLERVIEVLSTNPARIAGLDDRHGRPVAVGEPANLVVFDPAAEWTVSGSSLASRSRNTPYEGVALRGRVRHTIVAGRPVVVDGRGEWVDG
jgi:dihydroorotase